ncbi:putative isoleucine N-monooxygenase [Helianthus annuus]|nr:putative isoleucine N-monooxygenase [Helianthus annuus]
MTIFFLTHMSICYLFLFLLIKFTSSKLRPPLPPGPTPLPYVGSIISMLRNKPTFRWIHRMMNEMNTKILCVRLGNVHVIAVSDPAIALEFLKDKDWIFSSRPDSMSGYLTSGGYLDTVLAPMGDHWKKMRSILSMDILSGARHKWLQKKRNEEDDNILRYVFYVHTYRCQSCQVDGLNSSILTRPIYLFLPCHVMSDSLKVVSRSSDRLIMPTQNLFLIFWVM